MPKPTQHLIDKPEKPLLSDEENEALVAAVVRGNGGCIEEKQLIEQFQTAFDWAQESRINIVALDLVLSGALFLQVAEDGEIIFGMAKGPESDE